MEWEELPNFHHDEEMARQDDDADDRDDEWHRPCLQDVHDAWQDEEEEHEHGEDDDEDPHRPFEEVVDNRTERPCRWDVDLHNRDRDNIHAVLVAEPRPQQQGCVWEMFPPIEDTACSEVVDEDSWQPHDAEDSLHGDLEEEDIPMPQLACEGRTCRNDSGRCWVPHGGMEEVLHYCCY